MTSEPLTADYIEEYNLIVLTDEQYKIVSSFLDREVKK